MSFFDDPGGGIEPPSPHQRRRFTVGSDGAQEVPAPQINAKKLALSYALDVVIVLLRYAMLALHLRRVRELARNKKSDIRFRDAWHVWQLVCHLGGALFAGAREMDDIRTHRKSRLSNAGVPPN